jgi:F0F1-type ATP synthase assembly protein I
MDPSPPPSPPPPRPERAAWAKWTAAGFEFGASVLLFFLLGQWLDARWGTPPWLTLLGTFTGVAAGTYLLVRQALRAERAEARSSAAPLARGSPEEDGSRRTAGEGPGEASRRERSG